MKDLAELADWLEKDEARSRSFRAERLGKLLDVLKLPDDGMLHWGSTNSLLALTELRLAYIHGLYLSTVLLALTFIERELAGRLHAAGWDKAATANLEVLVQKSAANGILTDHEAEGINRLRTVRNAYVHYRSVAHPMSTARRALTENGVYDELPEADAVFALTVLASFISRHSFLK